MASKGERTRTSILRAAVTRFAREGFRNTSVADIARDAGLTPTGVYAYFTNKEALFMAAVDEDAAGEIGSLTGLLDTEWTGDWGLLITTLLDALEDHPLAKRMLSGLEPEFTARLTGIAALEQLRKGLADLLHTGQADGKVRTDVDAATMAGGLVTIVMSLLIALLQTGAETGGLLGAEVVALLEAALHPITS